MENIKSLSELKKLYGVQNKMFDVDVGGVVVVFGWFVYIL